MVSIALSGLALLVAVAALAWVLLGSHRPGTGEAPPYDDEELRSAVQQLAEEITSLHAAYAEFERDVTIAVDDGIRDMKRRENRVRATIRRAREQLEEGGAITGGLEAEVRDLQLEHGDGGAPSGVPAMPGNVGGPQQGSRFAVFPGDWRGFE